MQTIDSSVVLQLKDDRKITGLDYADAAEKVIVGGKQGEGFFGPKNRDLTTTSIRSIYGLIMNIYKEIDDAEDFEKRKGDLQYLKVRMAYESGRKGKEPVKGFLESSGLIDAISSVKTYEQFLLYCRYAESLVAYFKYYGGRD